MKARSDHQPSLPPMEVQRLDYVGESPSPKSGRPVLPDISLDMAKCQIGGALRATIAGAALKEFGDPSHVNRVCEGELPGPLARAWQREESRRDLVVNLAKASGLFDVEFQIRERRRA